MGCPSETVIGDNLVFSVSTHDPDSGILSDAESPPIYRVYEDETATPILTGTMAKLDDSNTVGFYTELIACTLANGFEEGKTYTIYIEATVDGDTGGITYAFKCVTKSSYALTAAERLSIADALLSRSVSTVEVTASQDSLCEIILAILHSAVSGSAWTIKRTDDSTTFEVKTVTSSSLADPITGVSG